MSVISKVLINLTVASGFEKTLQDECKEKLSVCGEIGRGHVLIEVDVSKIENVLNLKGVDHVYLVIYPETPIVYPPSEDNVPQIFEDLFERIDWTNFLKIWSNISNQTIPQLCKVGEPTCEMLTQEPNHFAFKVDCIRKGNCHKFTSKEAAAFFGGVICDHFNWPVNLREANLVVLLDIKQDSISVKIPLNIKSLHRRNIVNLGPTSLRNTIAYNMLRTCCVNFGDIVCDIMCGGASIPIEGALNWLHAVHICGDNHPKALERASENISHIKNSNQILGELQLLKWDATRLPLRDNIIDAVITDLPFGKRSGTKSDNATLYPAILAEAARVCVQGGRALYLTKDISSFNQV